MNKFSGQISGARHRAESTPSIKQGSTGAPSKHAVSLFRQGQSRTHTSRSTWDTRSTEPSAGSFNARVRFHVPKAYSQHPDRPRVSTRSMKQAKRGLTSFHQDMTIENPHALAEAHRHPEMRDIIHRSIGVVREHQAKAIEEGHARKLIPEGTHPSSITRAYKHGALRALHHAGLIDYETKMDHTAKKEFTPLEPFMRYSYRRTFDHLNQGGLKGKWGPFRQEFGQVHRQKKNGKLTGVERMKMRGTSLIKVFPIAGSTRPLEDGTYAVQISPPTIAGAALRKDDGADGFFLSDAALANPDQDPNRQLTRAIHPRFRRARHALRLNAQRGLHHLLNGGVTREERWQLGFNNTLPVIKRLLTEDDVRAAARDTAKPSEGQKEAGNYRKGKLTIGGLQIAIENAKGSLRSKTNKAGHSWSVRMPAHYGYILGTVGADGDHVDVYLGPKAHEAEDHPVFVVDQQHAHNGAFDEHKVLMGFEDEAAAIACYDKAFTDASGPKRRRAVHEMTFDAFKKWLGDDTTKPLKKNLALALAGAGIGALAARKIGAHLSARSVRGAASRSFQSSLQAIGRTHLKTFEGGHASPHVLLHAKATARAAKKSALAGAIRQRDKGLAALKPSRRATIAGAAIGGAAGFSGGIAAHPTMPPLYQAARPLDDDQQ